MTATEVLRRLLDERGVEWETDRSGFRVMWGKPVDEFHDTMQFKAVDNALPNGGLNVHICGFTPEQAIAATLGATDAKPTQVESSGTCHDVWDVELTGRLRFQCSECGAVSLEITPRFCPACGAKVVEPTKNDVDVEVEQ